MKDDIREIEQQLRELEMNINETAKNYYSEARKVGETKAKFEISQAGALLAISNLEGSSGEKLTEAIRKAKALNQCQQEYLDYRIAEALADSSREYLRALQSQLSSVQTRASLIKTEANLINFR